MDKTAIKNFAVWARTKLISNVEYKAGLLGITKGGIADALPQSTGDAQFFNIGTKDPYCITGRQISQRNSLVRLIEAKAEQSDFATAYDALVEEVSYTWFNRLIAIRFMEVNDYLPSHIRVLSSEAGKAEPDLVSTPFDAELAFTEAERAQVLKLQDESKSDELFRLLFIKQCNALNAILPELFEKTDDHTELLFSASFTDPNGVVAHLVSDIAEEDFKEAVEIIGWMYQYYNTEPKQDVFDGLKKNIKISKEKIPAATQLFTPDWIVRYMIENSLGRLWIEHLQSSDTLTPVIAGSDPQSSPTAIANNWKYYIQEAEQTPEVKAKLKEIRATYKYLTPEDIKFIDPCMGSGHILVYAFDVLMQIYESAGHASRDAAKLILENNLYGLDIDKRAYQLSYFALMMKARQYNRRILNGETTPQVYHPTGDKDCEEFGSLMKIDEQWDAEKEKPQRSDVQISIEDLNYEQDLRVWNFKRLLTKKYDVVCTNPPYLGSGGMSVKMTSFVETNYIDGKADLFAAFILRCFELSRANGIIGMMTSYTWMFLSGYQSIRETILYSYALTSLIQPEYHSFFEEAYVPICTFTARKAITHESSINIRLEQFKGASIQSEKALEAIADINCKYRYVFNPDVLHAVPGSPLVYWANSTVFEHYKTCPLIQSVCPPKPGLSTGDNDRFLRFWQEISFTKISFKGLSQKKWYPINKGGEFRRWYGNHQYIVNWDNDGFEIRNFKEKGGRLKSRPQNLQWNFKSAISWSLITTGAISLRFYPAYFMQNAAGICCYPTDENFAYMLAFLNTKPAQLYASILSPTMNTNAGDIARIPVVYRSEKCSEIERIVADNINLACVDWDVFETSWDFKSHPLL
ncbi:MAG: BREX-1 system adenine-specific DNA-methyltransferase PglX [Clostridiales Family XIII bacterium]|jgi:hypothetical protein|nr:BREX-1 system adenine-specific DNA-methyltransferase PglX [Clostridiales Family XIII bacterium]